MLFQSLLFSCPSVDNNYNEDCLLELLQSGADFRAAAGIHSWNSMVSNRAGLVWAEWLISELLEHCIDQKNSHCVVCFQVRFAVSTFVTSKLCFVHNLLVICLMPDDNCFFQLTWLLTNHCVLCLSLTGHSIRPFFITLKNKVFQISRWRLICSIVQFDIIHLLHNVIIVTINSNENCTKVNSQWFIKVLQAACHNYSHSSDIFWFLLPLSLSWILSD